MSPKDKSDIGGPEVSVVGARQIIGFRKVPAVNSDADWAPRRSEALQISNSIKRRNKLESIRDHKKRKKW